MVKTRIGIGYAILLSCFGCLQAVGQQPKALLQVGLIADIQYADKETHRTRFYRNSLDKLQESVAAFNATPVDFTVVLGDLVDEGPKDLEPILDALDRAKSPVYKLLGNHDYDGSVADFGRLYRTYRMPAPYYHVDTAGWRFIFLNTNELAAYATVPGTKQAAAYARLVERVERQGQTGLKPWNGGIGKAQLKWLRRQLRGAERQGLNVLVFTHHPLLPEGNAHEALNNREILALISRYGQRVRAVLSGHNHAGAFAVHGGLPCVTLEGMVETADENAYGILHIHEDRLVISGTGRLTSRTIAF